MSEEQRKDEETEVEGHTTRYGANDDSTDDEVEGHTTRYGANDEPADDEVEGHVHRGA
jgi:pyruvate-formate lyase